MSIPSPAFVAALLGPFQFGMALVIVNTMLADVSEDLGFDRSMGGAVVASALFLGAGVGGLLAGKLKGMLTEHGQLCISLLFAVGNVLCGASIDHKICQGASTEGCVPAMMLAGRLITGFASGLTLVHSPVYLAAVLSPETQKRAGVYVQLSTSIGSFLGLLIGLPLQTDSLDISFEWWRVMFFIAVFPAILQYFLALDALSSFRKSTAASRENLKPTHLNQTHELEMAESGIHAENRFSCEKGTTLPVSSPVQNTAQTAGKHSSRTQEWLRIVTLCFDQRYRQCVLLGISVPVACQMSGIAIVASYSTMIFEEAGLDYAILGSIVFGVGIIASGAISAVVCDQIDHTALMRGSFLGMSFSYICLALSSLADSNTSGFLSVFFVVTFIVSFSAGCGFVSMNYASKVVPPELADVVMGAGQSLSAFLSVLLVLAFPSVLDFLGTSWSFAILALASIVAFVFLKVYMIEPKDRDLENALNETVLPQKS